MTTEVREVVRSSRDLALLATGAGVSNLGAMLTLVGLTVRMYESGPYAVAAMFIAGTMGGALGAPLAGWLVDRFRNRALLVATLLVQVAVLISLSAAVEVFPLVIVGLAIMGMSGVIVNTCASTLIARITAEDHGVRGFSWLSTARTAGAMSGTVLGGLVAEGPGLEIALVIDAVTSLVQAVLITRLQADRDPRVSERAKGVPRQSLAGLSQLRKDRVLVVRLVAHTLATVAMTVALTNEIFLVTNVLHGNEVVYGVITALWGIGVLLGNYVSRRLKGVDALLRGYTISTALMAMAFLVSAFFPYVAANAVAWVVAGGCAGIQTITLNALIQARTADEFLGRVFAAASTTSVIAGAVGYLCAGVSVNVLGPQWTLIASVVLICPATVAMIVVTASARRLGNIAPIGPDQAG